MYHKIIKMHISGLRKRCMKGTKWSIKLISGPKFWETGSRNKKIGLVPAPVHRKSSLIVGI